MFYRTVGTEKLLNGRWNKFCSNGSRKEKNLPHNMKYNCIDDRRNTYLYYDRRKQKNFFDTMNTNFLYNSRN